MGVFLIEDDDLLKKYNTICYLIYKKIETELIYNKNCLKTKIKSHDNEVTYFYDKKIPKVDSNYTCLTVISLESALKKDEIIHNCF